MKTCQPWCAQHIFDDCHDVDSCIGADVYLGFGGPRDCDLTIYEAVADLSQGADGATPSIVLHLNEEPVADLTPHQASAIAWALLAQVAEVNADPSAAEFYCGLAAEHAGTAAAGRTS